MMTKHPYHLWSNKPFPIALLGLPGAIPPKAYGVESASRVLLIGASKARRARWRLVHSRRTYFTWDSPLPSENVAAIKLLDSWLSTPHVERDDFQERLELLIEENRL